MSFRVVVYVARAVVVSTSGTTWFDGRAPPEAVCPATALVDCCWARRALFLKSAQKRTGQAPSGRWHWRAWMARRVKIRRQSRHWSWRVGTRQRAKCSSCCFILAQWATAQSFWHVDAWSRRVMRPRRSSARSPELDEPAPPPRPPRPPCARGGRAPLPLSEASEPPSSVTTRARTERRAALASGAPGSASLRAREGFRMRRRRGSLCWLHWRQTAPEGTSAPHLAHVVGNRGAVGWWKWKRTIIVACLARRSSSNW
mmetsp:Transcript_21885/g.70460  ORF Transcript_21885/g.70460 Transcript_21885/m.70460 type:complete len:257 (+) Transcript_21885:398-1168(+)